jgi:nucleoside-diphosphate-sugar epimerase
MRILVLGGTAWLGRCIASTAVRLGHEVTCLARGSSGDPPEGVSLVRADRAQPGAYEAVAGEAWDVAVDLTRQPGQAQGAVAALAPRAEFFVFVSSGNVYADHSIAGQDEDGALLPALESDVMESMETYGQAKVACERHVLRAFGNERSAIMRVGLIGGPGDIFDRTGYWPLRFARPAGADGAVLVPDAPDLPTQVIDVRDLAAWVRRGGRPRRGRHLQRHRRNRALSPGTSRSRARSRDTPGRSSAPTSGGCWIRAWGSGWASVLCPYGLPTRTGSVSAPTTTAGHEARD